MKKIFFLFICLVLTAVTALASFGSEQQDSIYKQKIIGIKTNLLSPLRKSVAIDVEYHISNKLSILGTYSWGAPSFINYKDKFQSQMLGIKWHVLQKPGKVRSFYVGMYGRLIDIIRTKYDLFSSGILEQAKFQSIGGGFLVGFQWVYLSGITIETFLGIGIIYPINKEELFLHPGFENEFTNSNEEGDGRIGLNIGYTFGKIKKTRKPLIQ